MALLAAGTAGAFWTDGGGGTALYAPTKTKEIDQHDTQSRPLVQYFKHIGPGDQLLTMSSNMTLGGQSGSWTERMDEMGI